VAWQYSPSVLLLSIAAVAGCVLAYYAFGRRGSPSAGPLVVLSIAVAVWTFGYAVELGGTAQSTQ